MTGSLSDVAVEIVHEQSGQRVELNADKPELVIGRAEDCELSISRDKHVSRRHAVLRWQDGQILLRNLSRHGSTLNQQRVRGLAVLQDGQRFVCGHSEFSVRVRREQTREQTVVVEAATADETVLVSGDLRESIDKGPISRRVRVALASEWYSGRLFFMACLLFLSALVWAFAWPLHGPELMAQGWTSGWFVLFFSLVTASPSMLVLGRLDIYQRVPRSDCLFMTLWGASVGAGTALLFTTTGGLWLESRLGGQPSLVKLIVLAPVNEELVKGLGLALFFILVPGRFRDAPTGLVLGCACGLGFALTENIFFNTRFLRESSSTLVVWGSYRGLVTAVLGHPVFTALIGASLGAFRGPGPGHGRAWVPILGLVLACCFHIAWNGLVVMNDQLFAGNGVNFMLLTALLVVLSVLVLAALASSLVRMHGRCLQDHFVSELRAGVVLSSEIEEFDDLWAMLQGDVLALLSGLRIYRRRRALRAAQVELVALKEAASREPELISAQRMKILQLRNEP